MERIVKLWDWVVSHIVEIVWTLFLLAFTAWQTSAWVDMATDTTGFSLAVRKITAVVITDGSVLLWQFMYFTLPSKSQRTVAGVMSWCAVILTGIVGVLYAVFLMFEELDYTRAYIEYGTIGIIAFWAMVNLAMGMHVKRMDPDAKLEVELADQAGMYKAERNAALMDASEALKPIHARLDALAEVRKQAHDKGYTPAEQDQIVYEASRALDKYYNRKASQSNGEHGKTAMTEPPPAMPEPVAITKNGHGKVANHTETDAVTSVMANPTKPPRSKK